MGLSESWAPQVVNMYFIPFVRLVMDDDVGLFVVARTPVVWSLSRIWSRLIWAPLFFAAAILVAALISALEVIVQVMLRERGSFS